MSFGTCFSRRGRTHVPPGCSAAGQSQLNREGAGSMGVSVPGDGGPLRSLPGLPPSSPPLPRRRGGEALPLQGGAADSSRVLEGGKQEGPSKEKSLKLLEGQGRPRTQLRKET